MELESDSHTNCNWNCLYHHQRISTETGELGNKRTNRDHPNNSIVKIRQNTEKSPGDMRRFAFTQSRVRNHRLMLVGKNLKTVK